MLAGKPDPAGVRHLLALVEDEHAGDGDAVQREHRGKIDELALGVVRHEDGELERRSDRQGVAARLLEVWAELRLAEVEIEPQVVEPQRAEQGRIALGKRVAVTRHAQADLRQAPR